MKAEPGLVPTLEGLRQYIARNVREQERYLAGHLRHLQSRIVRNAFILMLLFGTLIIIVFLIYLFKNFPPTAQVKNDAWDVVGVFVAALTPFIVTWGIKLYDQRQRAAEEQRNANQGLRADKELILRQLESVQRFLPQLLSDDQVIRGRTIELIHAVDEDLANILNQWQSAQFKTETDRALRPWEGAVTAAGVDKLKEEYWLATTDEIIRPKSDVTFHDAKENYGSYLTTRDPPHTLHLPPRFRMGKYLVTNEVFFRFMQNGGYSDMSYWGDTPKTILRTFLCQDGRTNGPSTWPSYKSFPTGKERHPVAGISYYEALAFCQWMQQAYPSDGWHWCLPTEDIWEFTARPDITFLWPWGDKWANDRCNSIESNIGTTSDVNRFPPSERGCYDLAGNVWEFVVAADVASWSCVLRGGSYKNNLREVKSSLRLHSVPRYHRPLDFGFRLAQVPNRI